MPRRHDDGQCVMWKNKNRRTDGGKGMKGDEVGRDSIGASGNTRLQHWATASFFAFWSRSCWMVVIPIHPCTRL